MDISFLKDFFNSQLELWPLAKKNFDALKSIKRKPFTCGDLNGWVQYNPARAGSTLAKVDNDSIKQRKCFLCPENRPQEQLSIEIGNGFKLLINPFPIVPFHFTIVSERHIPQTFNYETGYELAKEFPGMVIFFNGVGAGASAPDHLHWQMAPIEELPLIQLFQTNKDCNLPFNILEQPKKLNDTNTPLNAFFWQENPVSEVNCKVILRKSHRPDHYFKAPPFRRAVSPGALDLTGIIVTPFEEDFNLISNEEIKDIYTQTAGF